MKKKYYILVLTFLSLFLAQNSYGFGSGEGNNDDYGFDWDTYIEQLENLFGEDNVTVFNNWNDFQKAHPGDFTELSDADYGDYLDEGADNGTCIGVHTQIGEGVEIHYVFDPLGDISFWNDSFWDDAGSFGPEDPIDENPGRENDDDSGGGSNEPSEDIAVTATNLYSIGVSVTSLPNGNILIKASDGIYKKPSAFNPNLPADRRIMNLFAASLAKGLQGLNKGIIISSKANTDPSSKSPASTSGNSIYLNTNGGYSTSLDNVHDFKSIIKHEIFHVDDNKDPTFISSLATHADVYIKAANDPTYKDTTPEFRIGNARSFANYLLNMDTKKDTTITRDVIVAKITAFNNNVTDVTIVIADYYMQKGSLKLKVQFGSNISDYITNTPINE